MTKVIVFYYISKFIAINKAHVKTFNLSTNNSIHKSNLNLYYFKAQINFEKLHLEIIIK